METKPGWKTSEFWLSAAAMVLGLLFASGLLVEGSLWMHLAGLGATLLSALGYTVNRAMLKATDAKASALKSLAESKDSKLPPR